MTSQRLFQLISLAIFLLLLTGTIGGWIIRAGDLYLRLDPFLVGGTVLVTTSWRWAYIPAVLVVLSGLLVGRAFCGYLCPMGTTLDAAGLVTRRHHRPDQHLRSLRRLKYLLLAFLTGAALVGVSHLFWVSPLSLITRLYGLVIHPLTATLGDGMLTLLHPLAERAGWDRLIQFHIQPPRFASQLFIVSFFVALILMARYRSRFWCRYLCPAGAMLALTSLNPLLRRIPGKNPCTQCAQCVRRCPMDAIDNNDPLRTDTAECIACGTCQRVCPEQAIAFGLVSPTLPPAGTESSRRKTPSKTQAPLVTRRQVIYGGMAGAGMAAVNLTGLSAPFNKAIEGQILPEELLRPPAALPEKAFQQHCVRCGACMAACPTNTLQPIGFQAGITALFSPAITPRRGYCDPRCHRCAEVCPTGAMRPLPPEERLWAKTGTAVILRHKCLAWEHHKSCMVCDEVCPFDAIDFKRQPGNPFAVPHIIEDRCAGCGYCEYYCPVYHQAAVIVTPMGAMRLETDHYVKQGRAMGLQLRLKTGHHPTPKPQTPPDGYPPVEVAPGFDPA